MSQSIIYPLGKSEIKMFYPNKNRRERKMALLLMWSHPWPVWGLTLITGRGENYISAQGWWMTSKICVQGLKGNGDRGIYLENGGWGSGEAGRLKAQDAQDPQPGPFLCFRSSPLAKWPASLMLPICKEYRTVPGVPPLLPRVLHSSLTHFPPCLFRLLEQLLDSGSVG